MATNTYQHINLCLSDIPKEQIFTANNGKKYVTLQMTEKRGGTDQYGNSHNLYIHMKTASGEWTNVYVGKVTTKEFGQHRGVPPQPQGRTWQSSQPQAQKESRPASQSASPADDFPF